MRTLSTFILLLSLSACSSIDWGNLNAGIPYYFPKESISEFEMHWSKPKDDELYSNMSIMDGDTNYTYFTNKGPDRSLNRYYSQFLFQLEEPVLYKRTEGRAIRLLALRCWEEPIVLRIEHFGDEARIYTKIGSGRSGFDIPELIANESGPLLESQWEETVKLTEAMDIWNQKNGPSIPQTDGSTFILEVQDGSRYNMIKRRSIGGDTHFKKLWANLIDWSVVDIPGL